MSQWSETLVARFARSMRQRRQALGLSAQEVADRTKAIGHPIGRSAIAAWENNSRGDRMMIGDALVLAEALNMPLSGLLYPDMPDGPVEAVPNVEMSSFGAARRLSGVERTVGALRHPSRTRADWWGAEDMKLVYVLPTLSNELATLRGERHHFQLEYEAALTSGGDLERPRQLIDAVESRITDVTKKIRDLGGVVNDG